MGKSTTTRFLEASMSYVKEDTPEFLYTEYNCRFREKDENSFVRDFGYTDKLENFNMDDGEFLCYRIKPNERLEFSALTYVERGRSYEVTKGKLKRLSDFDAMPMVKINEQWVERPDLLGVPMKAWYAVLESEGLFPWQGKGIGNDVFSDKWFREWQDAHPDIAFCEEPER